MFASREQTCLVDNELRKSECDLKLSSQLWVKYATFVLLSTTNIYCHSVGNTKNRIFFSPCGNMMLLMMGFEKMFLWHKMEKDNSGTNRMVINRRQ